MSDVPGRIYRIAKSYLDAARGRLDEIDSAAQRELNTALEPGGSASDYGSPANSDPMERAAAKIASSRSEVAARKELAPQRYNFSTPDPSNTTGLDTDPIQTAYKVIGVPLGSDYPTVEKAVTQLRERAAPSRFPAGSKEQEEAQRIQERVDQAFTVIQDSLGIEKNRFDRLEI